MAGILQFRRGRRRARRGDGGDWGSFRSMLWTGLLLGLLYTNVSWLTAPGADPFDRPLPEVSDPWAESRRSREILRGQEKAPSPADESGDGGGGADSSTATLSSLRVIDGDTFWLGGEKIRIADIDTPELAARCPAEADLARRATARLSGLLAEGPFELSPIGGRDEDRYGRKLRIVTRGGQSLGDVLVAEGLARTWTGRREPWCR